MLTHSDDQTPAWADVKQSDTKETDQRFVDVTQLKLSDVNRPDGQDVCGMLETELDQFLIAA